MKYRIINAGPSNLTYHPGPVVTINMLRSEVRDRRNAYTRMGDSGGPLLIGLGQVGAMETPTPIPASSGLTQRRYVAGVASLGSDWPVPGTACSAAAPCAAGEKSATSRI